MNNIKKNSILLLLALLLSAAGRAQGSKFLTDRYSQRANSNAIKSGGYAAFNMTVSDAKWSDMLVAGYSSKFKFKSVQDIIRIGVNHDTLAALASPINYKFTFTIEGYRPGSPIVTVPLGTAALVVAFNPDSLNSYQDLSVYKFSGYSRFKMALSSITNLNTGLAVNISDFAPNLFIECEVASQRYDMVDARPAASCTAINAARQLEVKWGMYATSGTVPCAYTSSSPTPLADYKPVTYELEWTYVDDYRYNLATNTKSYAFGSSSTVPYDFRKNSTRVQITDGTKYQIPLIYEHGAIVYRLRTLRPDSVNYKNLVVGPWSLADSGVTAAANAACFPGQGYLITNAHSNDSLNWQYTVNFAEEGKYKNVVNYFDGALKDRQTQTRINTDTNYMVAVDKVYDFEGRPGITSLPVPVLQKGLSYRKDILLHVATNKPYAAANFDNIRCNKPDSIAPLSNAAMANIYYSSLNTDTVGMQKYVPDAKGYPIVHTLYSPDNTNKVQYQGGAGRELQLWKGHGTVYEYARPVQEEIDRLLGTEAGNAAFYPKQVITDPNGQSSFTIMDPNGKVAISGLQGDVPDTSKVPIDSLPTFKRGIQVCSDLLRDQNQDKSGSGLKTTTSVYNENAGNNSFKYSVATFPFFTGCNNKYLWAKASYNLVVTDDCGVHVVNMSGGAGKDSVSSANGNAYTAASSATIAMAKGKYLVNKQLSFSPYSVRKQVDSFVKANEPACYSDQKYFVRQAIEAAPLPCSGTAPSGSSPCDLLKQKMMRELYPGARYGAYLQDTDGVFVDGVANSIFSGIPRTSTDVNTWLPTGQYIARTGFADSRKLPVGAGIAGIDQVWRYSKNDTNYVRTYTENDLPSAGPSWKRWGQTVRPVSDAFYLGKVYYRANINIDPYFPLDTVFAQFYLDDNIDSISVNGVMNIEPPVPGFPPYYYGFPFTLRGFHTGMNEVKFYGRNLANETDLSGYIMGFKSTYYRYQDECVQLPDSIVKDGVVYKDLRQLSAQTFIDIFNDQIAEALLPLHPEYCKLQLCNDGGAFEEKLDGIATWQQAVAANLFNLDSIAKQDPVKSVSTGVAQRLKSLRSMPVRLDSLAMQQAYCGAGNAEEKAYCAANNYKYQIDNFLFVNDTVKQNYYDFLKAVYLGNRGLVLMELYDSVANTCPSCATRRMTLVTPPKPVFTPIDSLLSHTYDWTAGSGDPGSGGGSGDGGGDMPDWVKDLYRKAKNNDSTGMSRVPGPLSDSIAAINQTLNAIQVQALANHLKNCSLNPTVLDRIQGSSLNVLNSGRKLTPQIVKSIITDTVSLALTDLCHPFLVAYDLLPDPVDPGANYACGSAGVYNGLLSFLQRSEVLGEINTAPKKGAAGWTTSSASFALNSGNAYESQLGTSATVTAFTEDMSPYCSDCFLTLYVSGSAKSDTLHVTAQNMAATPDLKSRLIGSGGYSLSAVRCLSEDRQAMAGGLIAKQSAILDVACSACLAAPSRYYIWSRKTSFMQSAIAATSLANAVTCLDLKNVLDSFKADTSVYKYSEASNHPLFEYTLTNYLNYKLGKSYKYNDYSQLMEGCAITDKVQLKQIIASYRIQFNSELNTDNFINGLNNLGTLRPRYVRYKSAADANPVLLIDFNSIGEDTLLAYKNYIDINGTGVLSRAYNYCDANNNTSLVFARATCGFTPGSYAPIAVTTPNVSVWENDAYNPNYKLHTFRLSSGTALDEANLVSNVRGYLYGGTADPVCNSGYNFFGRSLLRSDDYSSTLKQQYLNYIYSLGSAGHSAIIAAADPAVLPGNLSSYAGFSFTYDDPYCQGNRNHVYAYKTNPTTGATGYNLVKNTILSSAGSIIFPNADYTVKTPSTGNALVVIRKANGDYWYRYFDATNTLYNVYITPPNRAMGIKPELYSFSSVSMGADPRSFKVTVSNGSNSITCSGWADFDLAGSVVAKNVILDKNPRGVFCADTLDCEYNVMAGAIMNGKASYARYYDSTTTKVSNDMMAHLLSTTKDSLVYCGTRQQYQYTLYYYDQAGNLTRTVPPKGVVTADASLAAIKDARSGVSGTPDTKLTGHQKQSVYRYNSLNQLVYQQTPDGGIAYFFYDAAGRLRFSQNSKQRPLGMYAYNIYDNLGRQIETGEVKLSCDKSADLLFDTSYCNYYTPTGTLYTATHPDFVSRANDNVSYPDDSLNQYIWRRQRTEVVRTVYDTTIKVIATTAGSPMELDALTTEHLSAQENLRNRVSAILYYPVVLAGASFWPEQPQFGTYYSYDYTGNVNTIAYDFPLLNPYGQRYKRVDYDYDLVSGKVNMISHNRNRPDQFYQRYSYDADNRIIAASTSNDGIIWNKDASYTYYKHGPLATLKLGDKIQSLEYAYTIQGWLKAINTDVLNPVKDMGRNGQAGDAFYPRDVIAHALHYFQDDYKQISTKAGEVAVNLPQPAKSLYNGNIVAQTTGISGLGTLQRSYRYDQLQRLKLTSNVMVTDASATLASSPANMYRSSYQYDEDGNITQLQRYNATPGLIDNFTYNYEGGGTSNNKLLSVQDPGTITGGNDLQPGQPVNNYTYDRIGNLAEDKQGQEKMTWDHFGKILTIRDTGSSKRFINLVYDGKGNRIWKQISYPGVTDERSGEYYVRDAGGNILSVYRTHSVYNKVDVYTHYTSTLTSSTPLTSILSLLRNTSFPTGLTGTMLTAHSGWVAAYTDKPVSYYLAADEGLKSTLLFSSDNWIDELRQVDLNSGASIYRQTMIDAGFDMVPMFRRALDYSYEGEKILEHYSRNMSVPDCSDLWMMGGAQYSPGLPPEDNAHALYMSIAPDPGLMDMVSQKMAHFVVEDIQMTGAQYARGFYDAVVADNTLFQSGPLRGQQGSWTNNLQQIVNHYTPTGVIGNFYDNWIGGAAALSSVTTADYRLGIVYAADPAGAYNAMSEEVSEPEVNNILAAMTDITPAEYGYMITKIDPSLGTKLNPIDGGAGVINDTLALAEHHIYGSSRLGVQLSDTLRNTRQNMSTSFGMNKRMPWYSYAFDDRIDSTQKEPYGTVGNTDISTFTVTRKIGRKYYELNDHLGNVLATVLDRKTGKIISAGLYDRWVADIASATDYYPGGMMMPGRNTEYSWSRMGAQGQEKNDEMYGKGNSYMFTYRVNDARINRFFSPDPLRAKYPHNSDYAFSENRLTDGVELEGLEFRPSTDFGIGSAENARLFSRGVLKTFVIGAAYVTSLFEHGTGNPNAKSFKQIGNDAVSGVVTPFRQAYNNPTDVENWGTLAAIIASSKPGAIAEPSFSKPSSTPVEVATIPSAIARDRHTPTGNILVYSFEDNFAAIAEQTNSRYFQVPEKYYTPEGNQKFIDRAINRGDKVNLTRAIGDVRKGSVMSTEVNSIMSSGYIPGPNQQTLIPFKKPTTQLAQPKTQTTAP